MSRMRKWLIGFVVLWVAYATPALAQQPTAPLSLDEQREVLAALTELQAAREEILQLREIVRIVVAHETELLEAWNESE